MPLDLGEGVLLYSCHEAGLRAPRSTTVLNPTYGSTSHWNGTKAGVGWAHSQCASRVRATQAFHMDSRGWVDIAYNFLVCPHGHVFEGRGLRRRSAANGTNHANGVAYAICYMGGEGDPFTPQAAVGFRRSFAYCRQHGGAGASRNCHSDWKATSCSGPQVCSFTKSPSAVGSTSVPAISLYVPEDLVLVLFDTNWYLLSGGKLTWLSNLPSKVALPELRPNDLGWRALVKAYGEPVRP